MFIKTKKGNSGYLFGFLLLVIGLVISIGGFYLKCVVRGTDGKYDINFLTQCLSSFDTWIMVGMGIVIATIGAFIIRGSN